MNKTIKYIFVFIVVIVLVSIFALFLFNISKSNASDNTSSLSSKVKSEIIYLDENLISMLNLMNNISYDNYKVSTKDVESSQSQNEEQSSQDTTQNEQSFDSSEGTSESGGSQGQMQNSESSSQTQTIMSMEKNGILTNTNKKIDWTTLKETVEELYSSWNTIAMDMYSLNIKNDSILEFTNVLNTVTTNAKSENKKDTMTNLLKLYSLLPEYSKECEDEIYTILLNTKLDVINAYVLLEDSNWDEINTKLDSAVNNFNSIINNVEINSKNQSGVSQNYILLKELQRCTSSKDADVFYINYKNFMKEMQVLV